MFRQPVAGLRRALGDVQRPQPLELRLQFFSAQLGGVLHQRHGDNEHRIHFALSGPAPRGQIAGMIEIHGKRECPFAWRVRICAREKQLPFEWLPFDVPDADPRAAQRNPEKKSPKLWDDGFELVESHIILQFLDEAHPANELQPLGARPRAQMRLRMCQLEKLEAHPPEHPADEKRLARGFETLERTLIDGRAFMGGTGPDLSDIAVWPFLWVLEKAGFPPRGQRSKEYWERVRERESVVLTRPV